jgi:signal transduction histidine kinase
MCEWFVGGDIAPLCRTIADTGIGIPDEDQNMIFEAFYRCGNVEFRRGLGMGLSIVSETMQQINGSITLSSSIGAGTTIRVEIPMSDESRVEAQP